MNLKKHHDRWFEWFGKDPETKQKDEKREKDWWNHQLRKARTMGMSYPRAGIIGKKHSVPESVNISVPGSKRILPTTRAKKKRTSEAELNAPSGHVMNSLNANFSSYTCAKKDHLHKYAKRNHRSERCFWNFWNRTNSREARAVKPSLQERYKKLSQDLVQSQSWNPDELAQNSI